MASLQAMMAVASPELREMLQGVDGKVRAPERKYRMNSIDSCSSEDGEELAAAAPAADDAGGRRLAALPGAPGAGAAGGALAAADRPVVAASAAVQRGSGEGPVAQLPLPEQSLLHEMVAIDRLEKIKRQLAKGTSVNTPDCMGETPLFWAHSEQVVDLLICEGADIHWRNWLSGCSAFYKFASQGKLRPLMALARHLRKAGCLNEYINDPASLTRRTPLHAAAANGFFDVVRELLSMHADPGLEDYVGKTALTLAQARGFDDVAMLLS